MQLPYRPGPLALDLLLDSTGSKLLGIGRMERQEAQVRVPAPVAQGGFGIDANRLETEAIEVTVSSVGYALMLPELLGKIPPDESIVSVSGRFL